MWVSKISAETETIIYAFLLVYPKECAKESGPDVSPVGQECGPIGKSCRLSRSTQQTTPLITPSYLFKCCLNSPRLYTKRLMIMAALWQKDEFIANWSI